MRTRAALDRTKYRHRITGGADKSPQRIHTHGSHDDGRWWALAPTPYLCTAPYKGPRTQVREAHLDSDFAGQSWRGAASGRTKEADPVVAIQVTIIFYSALVYSSLCIVLGIFVWSLSAQSSSVMTMPEYY
jgi:hypothetical protein